MLNRFRIYMQSKMKDKKPVLHGTAKTLDILAEISNIGIVLEIAAKWIPRLAFLTTFGSFFYLIQFTDPLIYFFRALIRLTHVFARFCGLKLNDEIIKFDPAKDGTHKWQTAGDIFSLVCFILAVLLFTGCMLATPVGITLAWTMGLTGLCSIWYFDYIRPAKLAEEAYNIMLHDPLVTSVELSAAYGEYQEKINSRDLFLALLIGLALLLICGSAAAFAPPLLVPILIITSKLASLFLVGVASSRFLNWCLSAKKEEIPINIEKPLAPRIDPSKGTFQLSASNNVELKKVLPFFASPAIEKTVIDKLCHFFTADKKAAKASQHLASAGQENQKGALAEEKREEVGASSILRDQRLVIKKDRPIRYADLKVVTFYPRPTANVIALSTQLTNTQGKTAPITKKYKPRSSPS